MAHLLRMFHTIRYLRPGQIYGRIWRQCAMPRPDSRPAPELRRCSNRWTVGPSRPPRWTNNQFFEFARQLRDASSPNVWNDGSVDPLWCYNLHYFDDLTAPTNAGNADGPRRLMQRWIAENPPAVGCGWEAYPTSLRVVNWIKWSLAGNQLADDVRRSLAVQTRWLSQRLEFHLLGNHLWANAKALVFAGLFFQGAEAEFWLQTGLKIFRRQLPEQVLHDGGHFELSPMYHGIVLEDLLDLCNLAAVYTDQSSQLSAAALDYWRTRVPGMLRWLAAMCHPDGRIAQFNDAAFGIAPETSSLFSYAERLGFAAPAMPANGVTHLESTGYARLQNDTAVLIADIGRIGPDYLPGHAHADSLTFELSLHGRRVIVNSGTSTYHDQAERQRQRATAAHNTVEVDGCDSSEVWGSFRVARRAYPRDLDLGATAAGTLSLACSHDGYRRLTGRVTHRRSWRLGPSELQIVDQLRGHFQSAVARLHFHPDIAVDNRDGAAILSVPAGKSPVMIQVTTQPGRPSIVPTTWHPEFGVSIPNHCWESHLLHHETVTNLNWSRDNP